MQETIGQRLKHAREHRHISLEKAAENTRIRLQMLRALEGDDYSGMVSGAQARGFLRNYADYLGLNLDELLAQLTQESEAGREVELPKSTEISGPLEEVESPPGKIMEGAEQTGSIRQLPIWKRGFLKLSASIRQPGSPTEKQKESPNKQRNISSSSPTEDELKIDSPAARQAKDEVKVPKTRNEASEQIAVKKRGSKSKSTSRKLVRSEISKDEKKPVTQSSEIDAEVNEPELEQITKAAPGVGEESAETKPTSGFLSTLKRIFEKVRSIFKIRLKGAAIERGGLSNNSEAESESAEYRSTPKQALATKSAEQLFTAIGVQLRERRNLLSLTLEEVERHTHIRSAYLKSFESGAFEQLPSPVQSRGLLSNYAAFLDLDPDGVLLKYAEVLQARHKQKHPEATQARSRMHSATALPAIRTFIASDVLFSLGVVVVVGGLAIWGIGRLINPPAVQQTIQSTAPSIAEVLAGTSVAGTTQEVSVIPAQESAGPIVEATQTEEFVADAGITDTGTVQVTIVSVARAFMQVKVDGEESFKDQALPGNVYPFEASNQIEVLTGNGAALRVTFNGREMGLMGNLGEVVNRIFTLEGIVTATPTLPPTPTVTPAISPTPTRTGTPTNTPTP